MADLTHSDVMNLLDDAGGHRIKVGANPGEAWIVIDGATYCWPSITAAQTDLRNAAATLDLGRLAMETKP